VARIQENKEQKTKILLAIYDASKGKKVKCPICGSDPTIKLYAKADKIGFATYECNSCGANEYASRMIFESTEYTMPF